jgi:hypothetical protein
MKDGHGECKEARHGMTGEDFDVLAEHRLDRLGLRVKLDKGFKEGTYLVYVEYDGLSERAGFSAARRAAREYCNKIKAQLSRLVSGEIGETDDPSHAAGPGRKRDLEATFLSFPVTPDDQHSNDAAMSKQFRVAVLRADQERDQSQARNDALRRNKRRVTFQERLTAVLTGEPYLHLDTATKERLLADVTGIVFPATEREL